MINLQVTAVLGGAGVSFLAGGADLDSVFTATFGAAEAAEAVDTEGDGAVDTAGFPAVEVVTTGVEFTNTGSVEGIGLPSLVWSFTTFPRLTRGDRETGTQSKQSHPKGGFMQNLKM